MRFVVLAVSLLALLCSNGLLAQQTQTIYLSGTDKDHTVDWDFFCTKGRKSGVWTKIPVPSCWELQGFGSYNYGHDKVRSDEEGLYRHRFRLPKEAAGKKVVIVFEASMTDTEVKVNGKLAGPVHQGAFYEFKCDITPLIKFSEENLLEVKVSKQSSNFSVNQAERVSDFWIFGGIFRPVYLQLLPQEHIERSALKAEMDGSFLVDVYISNPQRATAVEGQIITLDGKPVGKAFSSPINKSGEKTILTTRTANPVLWNPEKPHLYTLQLRLKEGTRTVHTTTERFGFRTVDLRPRDGIYVNGQKIKFKGVNRHSFYPSSGRTTSAALNVADVLLMKGMNMNAVRMSHYPPDKNFLDACDSLGLFVLDELTGWQKAYDTVVGRKLVKELVVRDVNHPSVIMWDNGNEGGNNLALDGDYHLYDPQHRPVIHPWEVFGGVDTRHYKPYDCCFESQFYGKEVFFPTEFQHGMFDGGHGAGLNDYWNAMMQNPLSAGGFLWSFSDEAVVRTDKNGELDADGTHGPDGILGPYREKEGSFYTIKEIWSPVYVDRKSITPQFDGKLRVENRYHYTNLEEVKFGWKLVNFPAPGTKEVGYNEAKRGVVASPDIAPDGVGHLTLNLPAGWQAHDALFLTATDVHNRELATWSWSLQTAKDAADKLVDQNANAKATVEERDSVLVLSANGVVVSINRASGLIQAARNALTPLSLNNGPVLAELKSGVTRAKHFAEGDNQIIDFTGTGDLKKLRYTMLPSGWLRVDYTYVPTVQKEHPPTQFAYLGMTFNYPEEKVTGVRYLGRGPYRVWKNRMKGPQLGVWNKPYNNTMTGYKGDYPEFKGYYSELKWAVIENKEHPITVVSATDDLFLRLFTPEVPQGLIDTRPGMMDRTHPPFPSSSISFMHAIPPVGNKFMGPEKTGPEGQLNTYIRHEKGTGQLHGTLYFNFGAGVK